MSNNQNDTRNSNNNNRNNNRPSNGQNNGQNKGQNNNRPQQKTMKTNRGQAMAASRRNHEMAQGIAAQFTDATDTKLVAPRANMIDDSPKLRIIGLGGMDGGGSKNMIVFEYENDVIITDCGIDLGADLPGVNYAVCPPKVPGTDLR